MIRITHSDLDTILRHGEETYPEECCGVMIANPEKPDLVVEIRKMKNINAGSKNTRYNIDPIDLMNLEDELDDQGLQMMGIYHSHPDHPARPSEYDKNHAWPNLSYMVMRTANGQTEKITSWQLSSDRTEFLEEEIQILAQTINMERNKL